MLGKIKRVLGIEGVRVDLLCEEKFDSQSPQVEGVLKFTTKSDGKVKSYQIMLVEQYSRGRKRNKLTDEYILGQYHNTESFEIKKEEIIEIPFLLKYEKLLSEMDKIQEGNFLTAIIIGMAKKLKGVKSTYKIRVTADVSGTKLDPFIEKEILFT